jgi:hypothetical protein
VAGSDYVGASGTLTFTEGQTQQTVAVSVLDDTVVEGDETFTLTLSNAVGATLATATATGTIQDDEVPTGPVCGVPTYDSATEAGVFLYYDCANPQQWHVRVTGGGAPLALAYRGTLSADLPFSSVVGFSQEASDVLTVDGSGSLISYVQYVARNGVDGIDFSFPVGGDVCVAPTAPSVPVWLGAERVAVTTPISLTTFGDCGP